MMRRTRIIEQIAIIIVIVAFLATAFVLGIMFQERRTEPLVSSNQTQVDMPRQEQIEIEPVRPSLTQIDLSRYDYTKSDESVMSAYEALQWLEDVAIYSHDYYIRNPELQNRGTGDTAYNERSVKQYKRLKALIEAIK